MERVRNYIYSWECKDLFIPIALNPSYAHLDHNWELDSSISRWALPYYALKKLTKKWNLDHYGPHYEEE